MLDRHRYSTRAHEVVAQASREAEGQGRGFIAPEHLLLGLMHDENNVASRLIVRLGVSLEAIRAAVRQEQESYSEKQARDPQLSQEAEVVLTAVYEEAALLNNNYIGTEHLLLALSGDKGLAGRVLRDVGLTQERVRENARQFQHGSP